MPRKITKDLSRQIPPDRIYDSVLVQRLINKVMRNGKKQQAERLVYKAMEMAAKRLKEKDPLEVLLTALDNIKPEMETRSKRVGGANYQVPLEVKPQRQAHLTLMWFIQAVRQRKGMASDEKICLEIIDAFNQTGVAFKHKEDVQKMAEANRAWAHLNR
ncbi:MAG: 30S ribosomal protein S7 [Candidatus Saccharibacteria bacterium]|nr:30S ribosomal protein S7 [Candidatus Saccharibacteria bacterium]MCY4010942.1 30S ribosomal protein S7 [Candidatus Saccharibacteria bacterium]MCY4089039.1 30S ribosomal protein S7 [Candidatus Saccharibacteria bacterium]